MAIVIDVILGALIVLLLTLAIKKFMKETQEEKATVEALETDNK